jgi:hypothetical protein
MFLLQVSYVPFCSHPKRAELRRRRAVLTHLPTGRKWVFGSRRAGMAAQRSLAAAVAEGRLSILPRVPDDAMEVAAAA